MTLCKVVKINLDSVKFAVSGEFSLNLRFQSANNGKTWQIIPKIILAPRRKIGQRFCSLKSAKNDGFCRYDLILIRLYYRNIYCHLIRDGELL